MIPRHKNNVHHVVAFKMIMILTLISLLGFYVDAKRTIILSKDTAAFVVPNYFDLKRPKKSAVAVSAAASSTGESEAERLLRKARELKAAAAQEEQTLHASLLDKKAKRDSETDTMIDYLFPNSPNSDSCDISSLVKRLKTKRHSTDALLRIIERLHERELIAKGIAHVESSSSNKQQKSSTSFQVVASDTIVNQAELVRITGLTEGLINAAKVMDEEWYQEKEAKDKNFYRTHLEAHHWTSGDLGKHLEDRARNLRRGYDEQYQKRIEEYYEKALIDHKNKNKNDKDNGTNEK